MKRVTDPLLVIVEVVVCHSVGLGNDGDQVDLGVELLHDLNVEGLQRVAGRLDEVDNCVNAVVYDIHAVHLILRLKVGIEPLLNVLDDGIPRLVVVDEIAKAGSVDDRQSQADAVLLDVGADGLYRDSLGDVETRGLALLGGV
jgi:hypothetical protein